ncbi:C4-dicarboxylate ABC transporter permease [Roseivivax halodurans JCM 10272]|uniref:TRAP transporter small permease protein n=1 Tax=Roseivivax halodurans JCM 10272 TaxID=1449350 RepID=X7ELM5_9RHOB|nr:TRAP transporter small permease subunit [Roseivivax halodurans]ETX16081.1 C4-dicarboxylate ABC transporter permease [Roseivivax halodurans JCM 10272]
MESMKTGLEWLHRRAENVAALMLAVMFGSFILQVVYRYVFNWHSGWASELTIVMWLWVVLWGAAFVTREDEEIRFDVIYGVVGPKVRRIMTMLAALALIFLYGWSLPAVWDYVTFMKIQETSYLDIRYDYLYSIYILFAVAILVRYVWLLWDAVTNRGTPGGHRGDAAPNAVE